MDLSLLLPSPKFLGRNLRSTPSCQEKILAAAERGQYSKGGTFCMVTLALLQRSLLARCWMRLRGTEAPLPNENLRLPGPAG